jgi:isoleucyl-tRNA synthetase
MDVWFDSGSSHAAVLDEREELQAPADLYLEGGDQYRGWFQSSMLTAVGAKGEGAPYKTVLTHGWVVDGEGKAMHKSLGNSIAPEEVIVKYGADLVRLWVASSDYRVDVRVSDNIFKQLSETYRKIRNTARIILANIGDFDPNTDMLPVSELVGIDKWALNRLAALIDTCLEGYRTYEFHTVYHAINNFCTVDMSKLYIDIIKDRVYVEKADSKARRSAQTAMYHIISALTRLASPLIAFTGEEIWQAMPHLATDKTESVFLNDMPASADYSFAKESESWDKLFDIRDTVTKALELARASKAIGKSLDAKITVYSTDADTLALLNTMKDELATVFIVSAVSVEEGTNAEAYAEEGSPITVLVEQAAGRKCDRCWAYSEQGVEDEEGGFVCERCRRILEA